MVSVGTSAQFHALVEEDLNHERAGALGRAGRRLGRAVAECRRIRDEFDRARSADDNVGVIEAVEAYHRAYVRYQRAHREFCIQREANRLFDHSPIDRHYPPPDPPARFLR